MKVGDRYGWLIVIEDRPRRAKRCDVRVRCLLCGRRTTVRTCNLVTGNTKSCGCYRRLRKISHGMWRTRLYQCWSDMLWRCEKPTARNYKNYGGRGVRVCRAWHSFEAFALWARRSGYRDSLTLDRRKANGDYTPSNCRWATRRQQSQNHRKRVDNTSGYVGVSRVGSGFRAEVRSLNKRGHLGYFDDLYSAAWVRDAYVKRHFDEYATMNHLKDRRRRRKRVLSERRGTFDWKKVMSK